MTFDPDAFNKSETWRILQGEKGSWYQEADESGQQELRDFMRGLLCDGKVNIDFVKADGTARSMTCTLNESLGAKPVNKLATEKPAIADKKETCVVWDCDANGWRSFRWDRLRKIAFSIE